MNTSFRNRLLARRHTSGSMLRLAANTLLWLGKVRQIVLNPTFRAEVFTRLRHPRQHFQGSTFTRNDRYPLLFTYAHTQLHALPDVTILSFGCSTGEEVFTLARYLPAAAITGVDINPRCIDQCHRRNRNPQLTFHQAQSPLAGTHAAYDAIFCLAVFQRTENHAASNLNPGGFRFRNFAHAIAALDLQLKPGGLLFIDHADFSFADTPTSANYQPANFPDNVCTRKRPLFGPDDTLRSPSTTLPRVFRKRIPQAV